MDAQPMPPASETKHPQDPAATAPLPFVEAMTQWFLAGFSAAARPVLFFDYDGTLVPFEADSARAAPSPATLEAVGHIVARRPGSIVVISGRGRDALAQWFPHPAVHLVAEHGGFVRDGSNSWRATADWSAPWMTAVEEAMRTTAAQVPGSRVEKKDFSICWHYRTVTVPEAEALRQGQRLVKVVRTMADAHGFDVIVGNRLIEVRPHGLSKSAAAKVASDAAADFIAAFGDDTTDEDMFRAFAPPAVTVRIGNAPTAARYRMADVAAVERLLGALAQVP